MSEKKERLTIAGVEKELKEMHDASSQRLRELYTLSDGSIYNAKTDTVTQMIPLDHAAEVLAKKNYEKDNADVSIVGGYQIIYGDWKTATPEERTEYINEAIDELKK